MKSVFTIEQQTRCTKSLALKIEKKIPTHRLISKIKSMKLDFLYINQLCENKNLNIAFFTFGKIKYILLKLE